MGLELVEDKRCNRTPGRFCRKASDFKRERCVGETRLCGALVQSGLMCEELMARRATWRLLGSREEDFRRRTFIGMLSLAMGMVVVKLSISMKNTYQIHDDVVRRNPRSQAFSSRSSGRFRLLNHERLYINKLKFVSWLFKGSKVIALYGSDVCQSSNALCSPSFLESSNAPPWYERAADQIKILSEIGRHSSKRGSCISATIIRADECECSRSTSRPASETSVNIQMTTILPARIGLLLTVL